MGTDSRTSSASLMAAIELPVAEDCLDCTIARIGGHRLCRPHWVEFLRWWSVDQNRSRIAARRLPSGIKPCVGGWRGRAGLRLKHPANVSR